MCSAPSSIGVSSITEQCANMGRIKGIDRDWGAFADAWRGKYRPYMDKVRNGDLPWTNLDALHRMSLDEVLDEFEISGFNDDEKMEVTYFWHNLRPWVDSVPGLYRLKNKFIIAPMSNGNIAPPWTNMAKNGGMPWDCILGAEVAQHYKPDPEKLRHRRQTPRPQGRAGDDGSLPTRGDLLASAKVGLRTAFVPRPREHGPDRTPDPTPDPSFNVVAENFVDLAAKLGA